ncbi:MAG: hypothetical protein WCE52_11525, partial [Candidatus Acidiferrum sp.]
MHTLHRVYVATFAVVCTFGFTPQSLRAQKYSSVVIWSEPGLPTADSPAPSAPQLSSIFPDAHL